MNGSVVVLTGLPGVGKTTTALHLAARLSEFWETRVLHTDVLKVTLRPMCPLLQGPSWTRVHERRECLRPILEMHAQKARRDGFVLVVEGTLADALPSPDHGFCLTLDEATRLTRTQKKPAAAREALSKGDVSALLPFQGRAVEAKGTPTEIAEGLVALMGSAISATAAPSTTIARRG